VLDPQPRPLPDSIPIEVRADSAPFTPRVPLPVPDPAALQGAPPPDAASDADPASAAAARDARTAESKSTAEAPAGVIEPPASRGADKSAPGSDAGEAKGKGEPRAENKSEGSKPAKAAAKADARFAVQAAAPRSEQAARDLMARLKSAGLPAYVERTEATDGPRWRVRAGPYATRAEAERARTRLRELGQGGDLVAL
jgi:DedD protein